MRLLNELQRLLTRTYDLDTQPEIGDFVVTCPRLADAMGLPANAAGSPEQVLVAEDGDNLDLAVYLDEDMLARLGAADPLETLHDGNLADFWTALEGVSHFVFLAWSAGLDRQTTRLELELQGEIDKFVLTAMLVASQSDGQVPKRLHKWLFDLPRLAPRLDAAARALYASANRWAAQYCRTLMARYDGGSNDSVIPELRRFYRLSRGRKIRLIAAAEGALS